MTEEKKDDLHVTAPALDAEALVREVRDRVRRKKEGGAYEGVDLSSVAALDFEKDLGEEDFLRYHLQVVERLSDINYGDFDIVSKGGPFGKAEVFLKKTLWKLLRFYTYRLFSQQREFDCQVSEALHSHYRWSREEIDRLRQEVEELKKRLPEKA